MSLVIDFFNRNMLKMAGFPGSTSHGHHADRGVEFHSDCVVSMEASGNEGGHDFVVLRFALFENKDGFLEANLCLIFDYDEDESSDVFYLPFTDGVAIEETVRSYLITNFVEEKLAGEGLALAQDINSFKKRFSNEIAFTTGQSVQSESQILEG